MLRHIKFSGTVWLALVAGVAALGLGFAIDTPKAAAAGNVTGYFYGHDYTAYWTGGGLFQEVGHNKPGDDFDTDASKAHVMSEIEGSAAAAFYYSILTGSTSSSTFVSRMSSSDIGVMITTVGFTDNSAYAPPGTNGAANGDYVFYPDSDSASSVVIYSISKGTVYAQIKRDCGNVVGGHTPLPQDAPPTGSFSISCNTIGTATFNAGNLSDAQGTPSATLTVGGYSKSGIKSGNAITIPYNYVENATTATFVIHNVGPEGSSLDVTQTKSLAACDRQPTGSASATCTIGANAAGDTYQFTIAFADGNQATKAQLVGNGFTRAVTSSFTATTTAIPRSAFPLAYQVADMDDNVSLGWQTKATISLAGNANCSSKGTIAVVGGSCTEVRVTSWDANAPTSANQYRLSLNGGSSQTYSYSGGQNGSPQTINVTSMSPKLANFDSWIKNQVQFASYDADSKTWSSTATVTFPAICDLLACPNTSTLTGWVANETRTGFTVSMDIATDPDDHTTVAGPKGAQFTISASPAMTNLPKTTSYTPLTGSSILTSPGIPVTPPDAGDYTLTVSMGGGESVKNPTTCQREIQVGYEPFFTVEGGDFTAGPGFGAGSACTPSAADIKGHNLDNQVVGKGYFGAASQQAAIANGTIEQFAAGATDNTASNAALSTDGQVADIPGKLALPSGVPAGSGALSGDVYGGGFSSASSWCVPDYAASAAGGSTTLQALDAPKLAALAAGTLPSGTYSLAAGSSIGGFTVGKDASGKPLHITIVASGSVFISGDITYDDSYTVTNGDVADAVPQFALIIKGQNPSAGSNDGNLYIGSNVDTLDGVYDVQPDSKGNAGTLYTCASGVGAPIGTYLGCNQTPLTFYGAVSAAQLKLSRTYGNLVKANGTIGNDVPAERFVYSPELWLGNITGANCQLDPSSSGCLYQAYTSLPPVL